METLIKNIGCWQNTVCWEYYFKYFFYGTTAGIILSVVIVYYLKKKNQWVRLNKLFFVSLIAFLMSFLLAASLYLNYNLVVTGFLLGIIVSAVFVYHFSQKKEASWISQILILLAIILTLTPFSWSFGYSRGYDISRLEESLFQAEKAIMLLNSRKDKALNLANYSEYFAIANASENVDALSNILFYYTKYDKPYIDSTICKINTYKKECPTRSELIKFTEGPLTRPGKD